MVVAVSSLGAVLPANPTRRQAAKSRVRPSEHLPPVLQRGEEVGEVATRLGQTEKQQPTGLQGVTQEGEEVMLRLGPQVDQHVPAGNEIKFRKRGVRQQVVWSKDNHVPNVFLHTVVTVLGKEVAL